ncbi:hypothetical protein Micbo1qcDRAFT_154539 [Microdochium bolleyi]|uniref:Uncharacterized protein n=1 Tax=Microdochium bolleyi TaxID=196109 RepID=A0A136IJ22_9PEZI|nr:hypothetical protein Micbo1qcDRAFT_154539 [Microdochium bolleyi]
MTSSSVNLRSITSSPPYTRLTAEECELKRQRDMARRNSKISLRSYRAMSDYRASHSPPLPMHEFNAGPSMAVYTSSQPQLSLLPEPVTTLPGVSTSSCTASPSLSDQQSAISDNSGYVSSSPPPSYSHSHGALASQYRPPPVQDHHGMMYPVYSPMLQVGGGPLPSAIGTTASEPGHVRVVQARPKQQCWEHGCNGRPFTTLSNLRRHQREKSAQAPKSSCPNCGAEFTRTSARKVHGLHDKCKARKTSP